LTVYSDLAKLADMQHELGRLARAVRLSNRRSLADVARLVGTDPATLSRWERGKTAPGLDDALKWLGAIVDMLAEGKEVATADRR